MRYLFERPNSVE
jgi:hypothetical protein